MNLRVLSEDNMQEGISLIEILLVIAIVAVIGATSTPFLSRFVLQVHFDAAYEQVIGSLHKAQAYTMDGKDNQTWGVCNVSNIVRVYSGSCNSPVQSEDFTVPASVSLISFSDTTFNARGEPSSPLNFQITSTLESADITLNSAGGITIN